MLSNYICHLMKTTSDSQAEVRVKGRKQTYSIAVETELNRSPFP